MHQLATAAQLQAEGFSPAFSEAYNAWARGWSVIPCRADKRPDAELLRTATGAASWSVFQTRLPTMQELFAWQGAEAFGCITGAVSGVVVLDVDPGGDVSLKGKHLPPTLVANTPRGRHYFYRNPPGGLSTRARILDGVDVRGDRGYVVMVGPEGRSWAPGLEDPEGMTEVPAWLLSLAKPGAGPRPRQATIATPKPAVIPPRASQAAPVALGSMAKNLTRWHSQPEVALRVAASLGIDTQGLGKPCRDILPGLPPDVTPSASLYQTKTGQILYRSFRLTEGFFTLGEVRASIGYGKPTKLVTRNQTGGIKGMSPEGACWGIRVLVDAGVVKAAKVPHKPLTDDAPEAARKVYQGFIELLGCKWLYTKGDPSPFSWRFASAWCGMGYRHAGEGMKWLVKNGYLMIVDKHKRTSLFVPRSL